MIKSVFENWVGEFLKRRFPFGSSKDGDVWRKEVLKRYYKFGETFDLDGKELYSRVTFALWFIGGQK